MNKFAFQNNARQSHLPASLAAHLLLSLPLPSRPFGLRYLLHRAVGHHVPRCIRLHPTYTLHRLQPRPTASTPAASPLSMRRGTHSSSAAHTATRATPQPYFFHSVLSIDQVLNFRVHPSRASTSSSSASSSASASSYCLLCSTRTCTRYSYAYAPMYVRAHTQTHTHTHPHAHYQSLRCPLPPLIHPYDYSLSLSLLPSFPPSLPPPSSLPPSPWFDPHPGCPSSLFN